jgi:hypothetical protein
LTEPVDQVHEPFRELISRRFDGELNAAAEAALSGHLADCPYCRQVDHDYAEQRRLLRAMPPAVPPRDLWARTSAAIDRELLRDARHGLPRSSRQPGRGGLAELARPSSVPSVLLVSSASFVLATVLLITQLGPTLRLPAGGGLSEATPFAGGVALAFVGTDAKGLTLYRTHVDEGCPNAAECPGEDPVEARVTFPASFEPDTLSLAPQGNRLAIMGSDSRRADVFAVMDVPPLEAADDVPAGPRPRVTPTPPAPVVGPLSSVLVVSQTPPPSLAAGGSGSDPAVIPAELVISTILDGVYGVGSAPAWSADGQALAFSAMPSDRSMGPDIYVWRVGDDRARPVTDDHRSYFASWSGTTIVASRTDAVEDALIVPHITTLAINLATREQREVGGPELWLPQVDPSAQRAVGWRGQLGWQDGEVVPVHGALYLVDWAALNPFADGAPVGSPTIDAVDMSNGYAGTPTMTPPPATPAPPASPAGSAAPADSAQPGEAGPPTPRAPVETDAPPAEASDARLTPIEPLRDPLQHGVTDWRVMWSADGHLLAEWVRDETSRVWGRLSVLAVAGDGRLAATPLLNPTAAKRGFNLATNRVAWVAPREDSVNGELRLRVWGATGVRDVRVRPLDSTGVVAAF